jgi:hypothetical protein
MTDPATGQGKQMRKRTQIKPSKPAGFVQMIGGSIAAIVGLTVVIPMTSKDNGPVWFGLLWTGMGVIGAIIGAINAFTDTGIPSEEIVSDVPDSGTARSTADRLTELEDMRRRELISQEEYTEKRKSILDEH